MPHVVLPQAQRIVAQLPFHLQAVKIHRNVERGNYIFAVKNLVSRFHVQQFDGENIRRMVKLVEGEEERRGVSLLGPPGRSSVQLAQIVPAQTLHDAEDIQVGMPRVELSRCRGTVQIDTDEVDAQPCGDASHKLCEITPLARREDGGTEAHLRVRVDGGSSRNQ